MTPSPGHSKPSLLAVRDLTLAGVLGALALILPQAFHMVPGAGPLLLPMFWPMLALGLSCRSPWVGGLTGVVVPLVSSGLTGMPPLHIAPLMSAELACLAVVSNVCRRAGASLWLASLLAVLCLPVLRSLEFVLLSGLMGLRGTLVEYALAGFLLGSWPGLALLVTVVPAAVAAVERRSILAVHGRGEASTHESEDPGPGS